MSKVDALLEQSLQRISNIRESLETTIPDAARFDHSDEATIALLARIQQQLDSVHVAARKCADELASCERRHRRWGFRLFRKKPAARAFRLTLQV